MKFSAAIARSRPLPLLCLVALASLLTALTLAGTARAAAWVTVDSIGDQPDAAPGLEGCETTLGTCTLRAAIEETNADPKGGRIFFDPILFDGELADTIELSSPLPTIVRPVWVMGIDPEPCLTDAGVPGPCVGIDGPEGENALTVGTDQVSLRGLAITGAGTAVELLENSWEDTVLGSWIGVRLDGSAGGNGTGVRVHPDSWFTQVLSSTVAYNEVGVKTVGAQKTSIRGNLFGVLPGAGTVAAANGTDIVVSGSTVGKGHAGFAEIGTNLSGPASAPVCGGLCNVIGGKIDLTGSGSGEAPGGARIRGNFIGLAKSGTAALPFSGPHVVAGSGKIVEIGRALGEPASQSNYIAGGTIGVQGGGLTLRYNFIGYAAGAATTVTAPSVAAAVVDAGSVTENRIAMSSGSGIVLAGTGAKASKNEIVGGEHGVLVEGDGNELTANTILESAVAGVRISDATGNVVGGDLLAEENAISASGGDAIEIVGPQETANEVARNHGDENAGLFIDLGGDGPGNEPTGPNDGIQPPVFAAATVASATGTSRPGATVRVFAKASPESGELDSYLGSAVADEEGAWEVGYSSTLEPETLVAATQTDAGATSELAVETALPTEEEEGGGEEEGGEEEGGGGEGERALRVVPPTPDASPPQTQIIRLGKPDSAGRPVRLRFLADEPGVRFECKLGFAAFAPCPATKAFRVPRWGRQVLVVRAVDAYGNPDPTPARYRLAVPR